MDLRFTKMHGCGNDFVVVDDRDEVWEFDEAAVSLICDRHFGIGADGMILVRPATDPAADFFMHYINADGTLAEMCGNGVRVFARYLSDRGLLASDSVRVQTLGGIRPIDIERDADGAFLAARVNMGDPVIGAALDTDLGTVRVTCVSMGNPHAIIWVDDLDAAPVTTLGPMVETHAAFPAKTNVEFAQVLGADADGVERIRLRVWERGVGETLACGTGACATLVAAVLTGRSGRSAVIELPGGDLSIEWSGDGSVFMTGPAAEVFEGVLKVPDDDL